MARFLQRTAFATDSVESGDCGIEIPAVQKLFKNLYRCIIGAYFEREAESLKLLETLESGSKGRIS
jgi:hypothetical protein